MCTFRRFPLNVQQIDGVITDIHLRCHPSSTWRMTAVLRFLVRDCVFSRQRKSCAPVLPASRVFPPLFSLRTSISDGLRLHHCSACTSEPVQSRAYRVMRHLNVRYVFQNVSFPKSFSALYALWKNSTPPKRCVKTFSCVIAHADDSRVRKSFGGVVILSVCLSVRYKN